MNCVLVLHWIIVFLLFTPDHNCQTLLLATDSGVKLLELVTSALTTIHEYPASAVDFRFDKRDVYFISNNQILYSYYSEYTGGRAEPIPIIRVAHPMTDLAVDWRAFKLYYTESASHAIYEGALLGTTIRPFAITDTVGVRDIAVDVYDRRLFYTKNGTLYASLLNVREDPSKHLVYHFEADTHRISTVARVAVDHHTRELYVVGCDDTHLQWHLVSTDYKNSHATLVFNGPELARPFALAVFDGEVLWGSLAHGKYTLYSCKLTPACDIDHLEIVFQSDEAINDVKFYNALVQTPDTDTACRELACSHNCTVVSPYSVRCTCPQGLIVDAEGSTCIEESPSTEDLTLWTEQVKKFLAALAEALLDWVSSQTSYITALILISCVIMLILLICGLGLLLCVRNPKHSVQLSESYDLTETRQQVVARNANR